MMKQEAGASLSLPGPAVIDDTYSPGSDAQI